jgi:hypothetical protein
MASLGSERNHLHVGLFSIAWAWSEAAFRPAFPTSNWQVLSRFWQTLYLLGPKPRCFLPIDRPGHDRGACQADSPSVLDRDAGLVRGRLTRRLIQCDGSKKLCWQRWWPKVAFADSSRGFGRWVAVERAEQGRDFLGLEVRTESAPEYQAPTKVGS